MSLVSDLRVLYALVFTHVRGDSHAERLEAFYGKQAGAYDDFRRRMLHGREELMSWLELPEGGTLVDLGGGTGSNIAALGQKRERLRQVTIVDLCPSLLETARQRIERESWSNVRTALADASTYEPPEGPVDVVTFSYSLTMMPDWYRVVDHAWKLLKPGGVLGVTDFYVGRKWPAAGMTQHGVFTRHFWPFWFAWDNVFLSPDHLPYLRSRFTPLRVEERRGTMPYLPLLRVPYYLFLGRKDGAVV